MRVSGAGPAGVFPRGTPVSAGRRWSVVALPKICENIAKCVNYLYSLMTVEVSFCCFSEEEKNTGSLRHGMVPRPRASPSGGNMVFGRARGTHGAGTRQTILLERALVYSSTQPHGCTPYTDKPAHARRREVREELIIAAEPETGCLLGG